MTVGDELSPQARYNRKVRQDPLVRAEEYRRKKARLGIPDRPQYNVAMARQMYERGEKQCVIAAEIGVNQSTVSKWIRKYDWRFPIDDGLLRDRWRKLLPAMKQAIRAEASQSALTGG